MIFEISNFDWEEAFKYAPFTRDDVAAAVTLVEGQNDSDSWVGIFCLNDGKFGYLTAWCDYTGWGCQESGHGDTRLNLEDVIRELCTEDDRKRLGISSDPEDWPHEAELFLCRQILQS